MNRTTDNQPFYIDAELVSDSQQVQQTVNPEAYDRNLEQELIEESDKLISTFQTICNTALLTGFQVISVQALYQLGATGLFPVIVAGLPVGASLSFTLTHLHFGDSWSPVMNDHRKFIVGVARTTTLFASAYKLASDAQTMKTVADQSFSHFQDQVAQHEGNKSGSDNFGVITLGTALLVTGIFTFFKKR